MGALRGNLASVRGLKRTLKALPTTMAHDVARRAAPAMTSQVQEAFTGGKTVYGDARPRGVDGRPLTLRDTGTVEQALRFAATGTIVRAVINTRYARYLIGKYGILPNGPLPASWAKRLDRIVAETDVPL